MADGRMLNKSISTSRQVKALASDTHRMLFSFAVPHLDRDGRMSGEPDEFRAIVAPLLAHVDDPAADEAMWDFVRNKLAVRYTDDHGRRVLAFPGFRKQQRHMKYDREADSKFGPLTKPETPPETPIGPSGTSSDYLADQVRHEGGVGPPSSRTQSAVEADEVRLSEEKGREVKGSEVNARARESAPVAWIPPPPHRLAVVEYNAALEAAGGVFDGVGQWESSFKGIARLAEKFAAAHRRQLLDVLREWARTYVSEKRQRRPDWWLEWCTARAGAGRAPESAPADPLTEEMRQLDREIEELVQTKGPGAPELVGLRKRREDVTQQRRKAAGGPS